MPQQKYPLRNNPRQTYEGDEWETVQSKKGSKNMRKQQKNGPSNVNKEKVGNICYVQNPMVRPLKIYATQ